MNRTNERQRGNGASATAAGSISWLAVKRLSLFSRRTETLFGVHLLRNIL